MARKDRNNQFGRWLRTQIEDRLKTQAGFASENDISNSSLRFWINGYSIPKGRSIVILARALGLNRGDVEKHIPLSLRAA